MRTILGLLTAITFSQSVLADKFDYECNHWEPDNKVEKFEISGHNDIQRDMLKNDDDYFWVVQAHEFNGLSIALFKTRSQDLVVLARGANGSPHVQLSNMNPRLSISCYKQ